MKFFLAERATIINRDAGVIPESCCSREALELREIPGRAGIVGAGATGVEFAHLWRTYGDTAASAGHGGGDLLEVIDFVEVIIRGDEPEIGIHQAMDMTLPGLVSQQSIAEGGRWLDVPDSRDW